MASNPSWRVRGRSTASLGPSEVPPALAVARPSPSRAGSADARARLTRISSAELRASPSRRRDSDGTSIRSYSSEADGTLTPMSSRSPAKRQRLSDGPAVGEDRRATWYGGPSLVNGSHSLVPDAISEDPSASLVLANETPPSSAPTKGEAVPAMRKQRSWTEMYREYAMGEPTQNPEASTSKVQLDATASPASATSNGARVEPMATQSEEAGATRAPATVPVSASWFPYLSLSRSRSVMLADVAKDASTPPATTTEGPAASTAASAAVVEATCPATPTTTQQPTGPEAATGPDSIAVPAPVAVRRPSVTSETSGSPNQASTLRTLLVGRGKKAAPRSTSKPPSVVDSSATSSPVIGHDELNHGTKSCESHVVSGPTAPPTPDLPKAPPVALSSSRSSWWSRSPAIAQETSANPKVAESPTPASSATVTAIPKSDATASVVAPDSAPVTSVAAADPVSASADSRRTTPGRAGEATGRRGGWLSSWYGGPAQPAVSESNEKPSPAQPATESVDEPSVTATPAPANPIIDTLPASRSTWARYFGGSTVKPAAGAIKADMEVMEVDFGEMPVPSASEQPSPNPPSKAKVASRPSSVRSAPPSTTAPAPAPAAEPVKPKPAAKPLTTSKKASKSPLARSPPNLVLPTFKDTFERPPRSLAPRFGAIAKALSVVNSYMFAAPAPVTNAPRGRIDMSERLPKTLEVMGEVPGERLRKVKRVVVVGVHGWFPAKWLSSLVGQPTGTSPKFASMMATSVREYLAKRSMKLDEDALTSIALEGEGKIDDRVQRLYAHLTANRNWLEDLRAADVVLIATHSQGSIVSTQLIAKLIAERHVVGSKITLLCMAAVAHGPFMHISQSYALQPYFQYLEGEAARELFTLQESDSAPTKEYRSCIQQALSAGVKVFLVASCDDQVVPLSSGLFHSLSHPGVLRAVFVDSSAFGAADFIINLITFAIRLRNAGLSDHELLPQLSEALAGSLTGVGHSRIYEEPAVYDLAVRYALETTSTLSLPTTSTSLAPISATIDGNFDPRAKRNPHYLPWILRGVIEDGRVRELFANELAELREAFEEWHPASKALKEVKFQLEPLRLLPRRAQLEALAAKTAKL